MISRSTKKNHFSNIVPWLIYQIQNDHHLSAKNAYSKSLSRSKYDVVTKYDVLGSLILFYGFYGFLWIFYIRTKY